MHPTSKNPKFLAISVIPYHKFTRDETTRIPSVFWHCWLGDRKGMRPTKISVPLIPKGSLTECVDGKPRWNCHVWERGLQNYEDCRTNFYTLDTLRLLQQCQSSDGLINNRNTKHSGYNEIIQIKSKQNIRPVKRLMFVIMLIAAIIYSSHSLIALLTHIVMCRDSTLWAVQKQLNQLRCSLECCRVGVQNTYYMGGRYNMGTDTFGVCGWLETTVKHTILGVW